jgi:hypothetical protein
VLCGVEHLVRRLGHVQFIRETISQRVWVLLQSTNDSQVIDGDY